MRIPVAIVMLFAPLLARAAPTFEDIFIVLEDLGNQVIAVLLVLATAVFLWGIVKYVTAGGDSDKIAEARNLIIFGIISLAVMVSVWGIVRLITDTFNIGGEGIPDVSAL